MLLKTARYASLVLITVVSLVFVWRQVVEAGGFDRAQLLQIRSMLWLLASVLLALATMAIVAAYFASTLRATASWWMGAVYLYSQVAKYVPGRVWNIPFQKLHMPDQQSWATLVSANLKVFALLVITQLIAAGFAILLMHEWFIAAVALVVASTALPSILWRWWIGVCKMLGWSRMLPSESRENSSGLGLVLLALVAFSFSSWMSLYAGAFAVPANQSLGLVFVSLMAWLAGLASVLPAGIGVREAAYIALRPEFLPLPDVTVMTSLAVATRLWLLSIDFLAAVIGFLLLLLLRARAS
jgi:uncharacterized membrane protein YbhN (UPF0104 family)